MRSLFNRTILSLAIAIFSMFFGAGNSIFPLLLGQETQGQFGWAFAGLLLTAIGGPMLGLLGATLFRGRCTDFFGRVGKIPGALLILVTLGLLGPFAVLPRCVNVAYAAVEPLYVMPMWAFGLIFALISLFCCWRRRFILPALGYVLSPLLIGCLLLIIWQGFVHPLPLAETTYTGWGAFTHGLSTGYDTMDLIAAIYFSAGIWTLVELHTKGEPAAVLKTTLKAGILGCLLLALIYFGLTHAAARFAPYLAATPPEQLMTHLSHLALGPLFGTVANLAVALACLTTVVSLTMTISDIACKELWPGRLSYRRALLANLLVTALMANLGFGAIMGLIHPVVTVCYPVIIVLTVANIIHKLRPAPALG